jgi:hypothetical protein
MDLLERYLQAIGQYLPSTTREDVLAELRANLQAQMDDRAEELGRPLGDADVSAILLEHGKPEVVASRYLPQRSLIGPAIFPFYEMTLRRALPIFLLVYAVAQGANLTFSPGGLTVHRAVGAVLQIIPNLFIFLAVVTLVFAVIEFVHGRYNSEWAAWVPSKLPQLKHEAQEKKPRSLAGRVVDLVLHCLWMLYVLAIPAFPFLIIGPGAWYLDTLYVRFAPVWHTFYLLLMILLWVQLAIKILALREGTQSWRTPLEFVTKLLGIAGVGLLAFTQTYFIPVSAASNLQAIAVTTKAMNLSFRWLLFFLVVLLLIEAWKIVRRWIPARSLAF